jgi:hypothetical protein
MIREYSKDVPRNLITHTQVRVIDTNDGSEGLLIQHFTLIVVSEVCSPNTSELKCKNKI